MRTARTLLSPAGDVLTHWCGKPGEVYGAGSSGRLRPIAGGAPGPGPNDEVTALTVDFGLDLAQHLKSQPVGPEVNWLTERRTGYGRVVGRSAKTLARWSDQALGGLRSSCSPTTSWGTWS